MTHRVLDILLPSAVVQVVEPDVSENTVLMANLFARWAWPNEREHDEPVDAMLAALAQRDSRIAARVDRRFEDLPLVKPEAAVLSRATPAVDRPDAAKV